MSGLVELEGNFAAYLARLRSLLNSRNLPVTLPLRNNATESIYCTFLHFTIDPDILEKTGDEVGAFSEQLKAIFGWKTRSTGDGIIPIKERGAAELSLLLSTFFPNFMRSIQTMLLSRNGGLILGRGLKRHIKYMGMRSEQVQGLHGQTPPFKEISMRRALFPLCKLDNITSGRCVT